MVGSSLLAAMGFEHLSAVETVLAVIGFAMLACCAAATVALFVGEVAHRCTRRLRVAELWIYPVKSCGGVRVAEARLDRAGLRYDREFAVVKRATGEVLSQKQYPALAAVSPRPVYGRVGELLELVLSSPGGGSVRVDVRTAGDHATTTWSGHDGPLSAVVYPLGDAWLSDHLGLDVTLCRLRGARPLRGTRLAPVSLDDRDRCRYQDGAPLTWVGEASVAAVNRRVRARLPAFHFRPNVVIAGCRAFEEATWARVHVGARRVPIRALMDCYRCTMVTVDQAGEAAPGARPRGHDVFAGMKRFLAKDAATHGPLPGANPNLAVFAAPDDAVGVVIREGDDVAPTPIGRPSIWAHNRARHPDEFELDDRRFWVRTGAKQTAGSKKDD